MKQITVTDVLKTTDKLAAEFIRAETLTDAALRELRAAVAEYTRRAVTAEAREAATCEWTEDVADGSWDGACGEKWCLEDGTPTDNEMNYCPKCGRHLVTVVTPSPTEDE